MRKFEAASPVKIMIGDTEYELLYTFGKVKRVREQLKVDLLSKAEVDLDIFTKVLFMGIKSPGDLTEELLDDLITVQQVPYYMEALQTALAIHTQPDTPTKNDSSASSPTTGSASPKDPRKPNSGSGQPQLVGESVTASSGA
jgi:hypothetical protein